MTAAGRLRLLVGAVVLLALSLFVVRRFEVTNDISHFLPAGSDQTAAEILAHLGDSELARTMAITVEGPDRAGAADGARALAVDLAKIPDVAWVFSGAADEAQKATYDLYYPRRLSYWKDRLDDAPVSDAALHEAAQTLKRRLAEPTGALVRPLAPADPLLMFLAHVERLRDTQRGGLTLEGGQLVTPDGRYGVIFLGTSCSPFEEQRQELVLAAVDAAFARVNAAHGGTLHLESTGVNRFVVTSDHAIRADIQRVSVISMIGVVLLFLFAFRSVRYVLLGAIPLVAGTVCAMAAGIAIFGKLHGITLAFGSSLIGTGIDYAEHYFTHHTLAPDPDGPEASLRRIWPGLALGALTTIAGLAGLAWTSFPGVREIAVFSTVGVAAALMSTKWFLPPLTPWHPRPVKLQLRMAAALGRGLARMRQGRRALFIIPAVGVLLSVVGLPRVKWNDDVSALDAAPAALLAEDARVRARIVDADSGRFVVAVGATDEDALVANDAVAARLEDARRDGLLIDYRSLHPWLRSSALADRSREAVVRDASLPERLGAAFEAEGFVPAAFAAFGVALHEPAPPPLTFGVLLASPLANVVRPFRVAMGDRTAILTPLRGVRDGTALAARLRDLPGVTYIDQRALLDSAYGRFRARTLEMIVAGLLVVFLIVHARYRRVRLSLAAFLPSLLAAAVTVSMLALFDVALNLLHLVGLLLVLSMGVDYGVFVVESRDHPEELGATLLSLVVAMFTTVLSFGLLALSNNPALRALGLVSGLGVLLTVLLAPAALVLLGADGGLDRHP